MGRSPCSEADPKVIKGPWTKDEDSKLMEYIEKHGAGDWRRLPKRAELNRWGKSCRLRWANYLRPDIKRGSFSEEEERLIIHYHSLLGNKWSAIAARLPGRTDNEIKNFWNTHLRKKLLTMGIDPVTHLPRTDLNLLSSLPTLIAAAANLNTLATNPLINSLQPARLLLLQTLIQSMTNASSPPNLDGMSLFGLHANPDPTHWSLANSGIQNLTNNLQYSLPESNMLIDGNGLFSANTTTTNVRSSYMSTPTTSSTPSLVCASPDIHAVDQEPKMVNSSSSSTSSAHFEPWRELTLDDIDSDLGWKDILDRISWSNQL